jgi:phosphosulfolactate synthase
MTFLNLPERPAKPRSRGVTVIMDTGYSTEYFTDVVNSHADLIDTVKFGWGTALATKDIKQKTELLQSMGVPFYFGGTLLEKAIQQNALDEFIRFANLHGAKIIEVSNGTLPLSSSEKSAIIERLKKDFIVYSEVGSKDPKKSIEMYPAKWVEQIKSDFAAGADYVIAEARESGNSGVFRENGELRFGLIEEMLDSDIELDRMIFEAPNKASQVYFIERLGSNVNLANISRGDVVALETLRLGIRFDTFFNFES